MMKQKLQRFLDWWFGELKSLVPAYLWRYLQQHKSCLLIEHASGRTRFQLSVGEAVIDLGSFDQSEAKERASELAKQMRGQSDLDAMPVMALLPQQHCLKRPLTMPFAAEANLREAVSYQINRISPFRESEVYFGVRVLARNSEDKTLSVEVTMVPKGVVESVQMTMAEWGLKVNQFALQSRSPIGAPEVLPLRLDRGVVTPAKGRLLDGMLTGLAVLLLLLIIAIPYWKKQELAERLADEIALLRPKAMQAADIKKKNDGLMALTSEVVNAKRKTVPEIVLLKTLTEALSRDVWLIEYRADAGGITITGFAPDASQLLHQVEKGEGLTAAKFTAPISRDQQTGLDRFSLSMQVVLPK